jgi:hypothetical protein
LRVVLEGSLQVGELPSEEEGLVMKGSGLPSKFGETIVREVGDGLEILEMAKEEAKVAI